MTVSSFGLLGPDCPMGKWQVGVVYGLNVAKAKKKDGIDGGQDFLFCTPEEEEDEFSVSDGFSCTCSVHQLGGPAA